jgi:hypothetical protein
MGHAVTDDESVGMFYPLGLHQGAGQAGGEQADGLSLCIAQVSQLGNVALRFDEQVTQVVFGFLPPELGVGNVDPIVFVDWASGHWDLSPML